ncbi:hypothetical protein AQ619_10455 [Caulobacter henricii]|uniref:AB hydrolase-1 domain-containing protein n=1 Tax=Caulobacter henricii TaxID=69395 RepID=A0A0P0P0G8_9CAUL|nr:hypothetical protein AQ619_10455 [Caulobacter henricii]
MIKNPDLSQTLRSLIGVQPPSALVPADGAVLAVSRSGKGVPVICLHATGHGGRDYEGFAAAIAPLGYEVIAVDWPGHGSSPAETTGRTASAERYAALLDDLIPALCGDERPILLGNSIGGAAALSFALRHPGKVRGLVLCNPGGLAPPSALTRAVIAGMVGFFAAGERGAGWFARSFAAYYRLVLSGKRAALQRARIIAAGPEMASLLKQAWDSFRQPEADLRKASTGLAVPVLFAWARHDQIVAWRFAKQAVRRIPGAEVQMFQGGHSAFLEDPEAFNAAFHGFVLGIGAGVPGPQN